MRKVKRHNAALHRFEPSIDSVVTKIPRIAFQKFPQADPTERSEASSGF
jgi:carbamoylphosphate synthase large subunit